MRRRQSLKLNRAFAISLAMSIAIHAGLVGTAIVFWRAYMTAPVVWVSGGSGGPVFVGDAGPEGDELSVQLPETLAIESSGRIETPGAGDPVESALPESPTNFPDFALGSNERDFRIGFSSIAKTQAAMPRFRARGGSGAAHEGSLGNSQMTGATLSAGDNPAPTYPPEALRRGIDGTVLLRVVVRSDGFAQDVRVSQTSGHAILDDAAVCAVRKWHFQPATIAGAAAESEVTLPIRFVLKTY